MTLAKVPVSVGPRTTETVEAAHGRVLVVDDEQRNRRLLRGILEGQGYLVAEAEDGEAALGVVAAWSPDVILLDVLMPKLGGMDVCRQLKRDPKTEKIPILIVSALTDRQDRLDGIAAGASDFLSKPIDALEVLLRVRNALKAKQLVDGLESSLQKITRLEKMREDLTGMIVHDLRSPLAGIAGNIELVILDNGHSMPEEAQTCLDRAMRSCRHLMDLISSILDVGRLEEGKMPLTIGSGDLAKTARAALEHLAVPPEEKAIRILLPNGLVHARYDEQVVTRVIANLVGNAVKHTPTGGEIRATIGGDGRLARVEISDDGPGISEELRTQIFEKYKQGKAGRVRYSSGLGLTFCKLAIEAHGGTIGFDSEPGRGTTFWFTLPMLSASTKAA